MLGLIEEKWDTSPEAPAGGTLGLIPVDTGKRKAPTPPGVKGSQTASAILWEVPTETGQPEAPSEDASSDEVLVELSRGGDAAAFGELIRRHYTTCMKRATFMIRNRSDAEDEVQNACWKAFQRLDQYRGEGTFSAWLNRIVENQCLMRIREARFYEGIARLRDLADSPTAAQCHVAPRRGAAIDARCCLAAGPLDSGCQIEVDACPGRAAAASDKALRAKRMRHAHTKIPVQAGGVLSGQLGEF